MPDKNPYNFCTWDDNSDCTSCGLLAKLACKWDKKILGLFMGIGIPPFLITLFGFVILGLMGLSWWWLIGYVVYFIIFFAFLKLDFSVVIVRIIHVKEKP